MNHQLRREYATGAIDNRNIPIPAQYQSIIHLTSHSKFTIRHQQADIEQGPNYTTHLQEPQSLVVKLTRSNDKATASHDNLTVYWY